MPDPALEGSYRRKLLLVYVHGFMGDETSFRSFPAHVHNVVTIALSDSHSVHTKIYPKYRPRYALEVARDDFSKWLAPHETPWTDVILIGHSMGGLLAADIALVFRHNIIGVMNFDVPFLGMHPGIVKAGLESIFKPWPEPTEAQQPESSSEDKKPSRMNTLFNPKPTDPNFNPRFYNDVQLPVRKGWENALHWMNKHSNGIVSASKGLVRSHIEFGGSMADYKELKDRYARVRALEEDNPNKRRAGNPGGQIPPRIRFLNYYTASTGRPKKPKSPKSPSPSGLGHHETGSRPGSMAGTPTVSQLTLTTGPRESIDTNKPDISVEEHRGDQVVPVTPQEPPSATTPNQEGLLPEHQDSQSGPELPDIPPIPQEPAFVDLAQFPDKTERRAAEKEHSRALQEYQKAVKARNKVIKERSKLEEKWRKQKDKEASHVQKEAASPNKDANPVRTEPDPIHSQHQPTPTLTEVYPDPIIETSDENRRPTSPDESTLSSDFSSMRLGTIRSEPTTHDPYNNYDYSHSAILSQPNPDDRTSIADSSAYTDSMAPLSPTESQAIDPDEPPKKKKYKKFCMLPPKDAHGNKDPTWVRVLMENVDSVQAHTTLFFMSDTYERLVGDTAGRIEEWVRENESERLVREMSGG